MLFLSTHTAKRLNFLSFSALNKFFQNPINKESKISDFTSRIRGYVDVGGPAARICPHYKGAKSGSSKEDESESTMDYTKTRCHLCVTCISDGDNNVCKHNKTYCGEEDYLIRRAVLMRSLLEQKFYITDEKLEIDKDVVEAFIEGNFPHGVRSIENIINLCNVTKGTYRLDKSCFPNKHQLSLFADQKFVNKLFPK